MTRLNRDNVECELKEMWIALAEVPNKLRGPSYDEAVQKAHEDEARLRQQLEAQDRLDEAAPDLLKALNDLFEQCAMIHQHWGDGSNEHEADAAIKFARAAIAKATGEKP